MKKFGLLMMIVGLLVVVGCQKPSVPIQSQTDNKVVYSLSEGYTIDDLKRHCYDIHGVFNTCGSPCEDGADQCIQVCAYTCQTFEK